VLDGGDWACQDAETCIERDKPRQPGEET